MFQRLTLAKLALLGAGLAGAAGLGAATVPGLVSAAPTATASPSPSSSGEHGDRSGRIGKHLRHRLFHKLVELTAKDTGQSVDQVRAQLKAGKSLADIAGSKAAQVKTDAMNAIKDKLDKAVTRGRITADQETKLLSRARDAIDKLMAQTPHAAAQPAA